MANNLTGDYEAVLQISVRQINGILATMHQSRVNPDASPSFAHSASIRLGDFPRSLGVEAGGFRNWVSGAVQGLRATTGSTANTRAMLSEKLPPGASSMFREAWSAMDAARLETPAPGAVRGRADLQLSAPTISFPAGAVSEVMVHAYVRAQYVPDSGTAAMPEPIHGEVRAIYTLKPKTLPDGRKVLRVQVSTDDNQLQFVAEPGTGLTAGDVATISGQVRKALRKNFAPIDVELPPDFAFSEFTTLGGGSGQAIVLPLQLSGAPFPESGVTSLTNQFLGSSEFAIAVSKEYVQTFLDKVIASIKAYAAALQIKASFTFVTATYTASVSNISMDWKAGAIEVSGGIDLVTDSIAPNGFISFKLTITVALDVPTQTVSLKPVGEPDVDESWWLPHGKAVTAVRNARDSALSPASGPLNTTVANARNKLVSGLVSFDKSASVTYTALEVTADGLILRGAIGTSGRLDPVVHFAEIDGGNAFTAFLSWIPGGRIERYVWTWVEMTALIPWFNPTKSISDAHRFVCQKPAGLALANRICLRIEGTRLTADGFVESVSAGESCRVSSHEPILVVPPWWLKTMVPFWLPYPPPDFVLEDLIAGHVNVVGGSRAPGSITTNTLVHFTGPRVERPLEVLSEALSRTERRQMSLLVILVLPVGTFGHRRSEIEERLGSLGERFTGHLLITEDYVGGWTRTFSAPEGPSTHLINARAEFVWGQTGSVDTRALAAALDRHIVTAPPPRTQPLRLTVQPGEPAPDTLFTDDLGNQFTLRRLRGRRVLLNFWQSWSAPCIRELRRLQRVRDQEGAPFILAVNGGEDRSAVADLRRRDNLSFPLIHDPHQAIATLYGVQCWPTTLSINPEGAVDRIQFGLTHEHREERAPTQA